MREAREETGLTVQLGQVVGQVELPGIGDEVYAVTDFAATAVHLDREAPTAGDDAAEIRWVTREELSKLDTSPGLVTTLDSWDVWP